METGHSELVWEPRRVLHDGRLTHMHACASVRVSKARDEMIGPEIQRDEISRFASSRGWTDDSRLVAHLKGQEVQLWIRDRCHHGRGAQRIAREGSSA